MKIPSIPEAHALLEEASARNPGSWVDHNRTAGNCARRIAEKCGDMDAEAACVLGLLHDIGRRSGVCDLMHTYNGYRFMMEEGYDDSARICLTHSFPYKDLRAYNGVNDCPDEATAFIGDFLSQAEYTDYDRLIQLCDAISFPEGPCVLEKRLVDVVLRRGFNEFTVPKWREFLKLREHFEAKLHCSLYSLFDTLIL